MKDHEIQKIVNDLRDIAIKYQGAQCIREAIHNYIVPILKVQRVCLKCGGEKVDPCGRGGNRCTECGHIFGAD